ncbi:MAG: NADH-quinone oxidoreductase subunit NuoF [Deltaproteobacteria bacterium]|nr:NADH-quinone oxidoreductase subunit NuoF [Deltaproteobacteria bacterium]MBI2342640.1 NADH-quinone oxidoreductase subunit NuoF [Deltaproteobacteria bacterium]MBI2974945.1 NADH-quinone oxidoreductase subunit NuoF [Deltaproteobacteria bacterium]
MEQILTQNFKVLNACRLNAYLGREGYKSLHKLFSQQSSQIIEEVKKSGLRGRGGAGFPTGMKWGFIPKDPGSPVYLCVNADEGEPGTFKDRALLEKDPHRLIEGIIIAAYAIGAREAFVYIRGEFYRPYKILEAAVSEAYANNFLGKNILGRGFDLDIYIHRGAGAYICGEETSLISSIEGKRGYPKIKPPFPAVKGLFGRPTIVNNVETLAALPFIISNGAAAYAAIGTEKSKGSKLISVSGHVARPGVYEIPLGLPLITFINEYAGGIRNGKRLKAVIPGGSSVPVLTSLEAKDVLLDYESLASKGTMLGSGGMIVMDESVDMVKALKVLVDFYHHESCGQCTPCREGSGWLKKIMDRIESGHGRDGDLDLLINVSDNMMGKTICVFADAMAMPVKSFVTKFRKEFEDKIN